MAEALTEDALARRINALSGGAPLPQAGTMAIAKRLLGPGLADRYGDVIGARPTGVQDVARDFAIGALSGDPFKADQLKAKVVQGYHEELRREEDQTLQREAAAREQLQGFFTLLEQGKRVPKELRADFFKEGLPKLGVEPTSPLFMKILTNYEKHGDVYDALLDPEIRRMADEDPLSAVEQMTAMGYDGAQALTLAKQVQEMKRYRADTQYLISRTNRLNAGSADPNKKARDAVIAKFAGRTITDEATGEKRLVTPEEALNFANQLFPSAEGAAAGIPQAEPLPPEVAAEAAPAGPGTSTTTTTTTTPAAEVPAAAPGGIKQVAPAAAGQQRLKKITSSGNVAVPVR
jgi:hypothetical protein